MYSHILGLCLLICLLFLAENCLNFATQLFAVYLFYFGPFSYSEKIKAEITCVARDMLVCLSV